MTEEEKRYSRYKDLDCPVYDECKKGLLHIADVVERLNAYENDITRLLFDHIRLNVKCVEMESRVKELEAQNK